MAQEHATSQLTHLFDAQWKNGLLPQIVFDPHFGRYFRGTGFWHADESHDAPEHVRTSGIVQPPAHATAALFAVARRQMQSSKDVATIGGTS